MFQIVQRLKVNNNLKIFVVRRFCNVVQCGTTSKKEYSETYHDYFVNSDRYRAFRKNSSILYEFDDETCNLIKWTKTPSTNVIPWNNLPNEYSNDDLIQAFEKMIEYSVSSGINLTAPIYDCFVDVFIKQLQEFTLNELVRSIQIFARIPTDKNSVRDQNFIELYRALDQQLTIKANSLKVSELLFLGSIWKCIPLAKDSFFSASLGGLFNRYFQSMDAKQLAQATHFINDMKKRLEDVPSFENIIDNALDIDMNLNELSIILWKYNLCGKKIQKTEFKSRLYKYFAVHDLNQLEDKYLIHILDVLTKNPASTCEQREQLKNILQNLHTSLSDRSLQICSLIANTGTSIRVFNDKIMFELFERCMKQSNELSRCKMCDLKRLSEIISLYPDLYVEQRTAIAHLILDELKNRLENVAQQNFHENFIEIIRNLLFLGIYNSEFLDNIFRSDYIKQMYKNRKQLANAMYEIDGFARINLRNIYCGNLLSEEYLGKFKFFGTHIPDRNRYKVSEAFVYEIENVIKHLFKDYQFAHAIGHHRQADIFVCINRKTLDSINVSERFPPLYTGKNFDPFLLTQNDPDLIILAFVSGNVKEINNTNDKFNICESFSFRHLNLKVQQLQILGFHAILIPPILSPGECLQNIIIEKINKKFKELGIDGEIKQGVKNIDN